MKTSTLTLTISHEGELPKGLLSALEAKAYDFTMAHGVACGHVVARESIKSAQAAHDAIGIHIPVPPLNPTVVWIDEDGVMRSLPVKEMRDE